MCPVRYFTMLRSQNHPCDLRLHLVRCAFEHGIRAAARQFQCSRNTVRKWLPRYQAEAIKGLRERSRAPGRRPHKTAAHLEAQLIAQRKRANPNANADVESFHNLVEVQFFDIENFRSERDFWQKVSAYQNYFNLTRKNSYKAWRSPRRILRSAAPRKDPRILLLPPVDLDTLITAGHPPPASAQAGYHVPVYPAAEGTCTVGAPDVVENADAD